MKVIRQRSKSSKRMQTRLEARVHITMKCRDLQGRKGCRRRPKRKEIRTVYASTWGSVDWRKYRPTCGYGAQASTEEHRKQHRWMVGSWSSLLGSCSDHFDPLRAGSSFLVRQELGMRNRIVHSARLLIEGKLVLRAPTDDG